MEAEPMVKIIEEAISEAEPLVEIIEEAQSEPEAILSTASRKLSSRPLSNASLLELARAAESVFLHSSLSSPFDYIRNMSPWRPAALRAF